MQKRHCIWGKIDPDEDVLVTVEMDDSGYKVLINLFMKKDLDIDFITQVTEQWIKSNDPIDNSKAKETLERDLSEDALLPDHVRADVPGLVRSIQNEWAYSLLTNKLWQSFLTELDGLKAEAAEMVEYDRDLFNKCKSFWERVLDHKKEKNINQERLDQIKEDLNKVFDQLKELRVRDAKKFEAESEGLKGEFSKKIDELKGKIEGGDTSKAMFESLKKVRPEILKAKLIKEHKEEMNKKLDVLFNMIKENRNKAFSSRLGKRISDLENIAQKMQRSIDFDKKEWNFQERRLDKGNPSQLEMQLRKAKMNMLTDKIKSKEEKLKGIQNTLDDLKRKSDKVEPAKNSAPSKSEEKPAKKEKSETKQEEQKDKTESTDKKEAAAEETSPEPVEAKAVEEAKLAEPSPDGTKTEEPKEEPVNVAEAKVKEENKA